MIKMKKINFFRVLMNTKYFRKVLKKRSLSVTYGNYTKVRQHEVRTIYDLFSES